MGNTTLTMSLFAVLLLQINIHQKPMWFCHNGFAFNNAFPKREHNPLFSRVHKIDSLNCIGSY